MPLFSRKQYVQCSAKQSGKSLTWTQMKWYVLSEKRFVGAAHRPWMVISCMMLCCGGVRFMVVIVVKQVHTGVCI